MDSKTYFVKVSTSCCGVVAKSKAQKDWGRITSAPLLASVGGWVRIGAALPKNGYVYLKRGAKKKTTQNLFDKIII